MGNGPEFNRQDAWGEVVIAFSGADSFANMRPRLRRLLRPKLKIYNTLTGKKEEFVPIEAGKVRIYVCGMTACS